MIRVESSFILMVPPMKNTRPETQHLSRLLRLAVSGLLFWGGLSACSDSSGPSSTPTTLTALEGMGLHAPGGTILPEGPTVRVLDQNGDPMPGIVVSFQVLAGGGTVQGPTHVTGPSGRARTIWILGREPWILQRLQASVGALSVAFEATTIAPVPGDSYVGRSSYVRYLPGDLPLVLSAPHGGSMQPDEIPDRTYGTTGQDRNTLDLALKIRDAIKARTGSYPLLNRSGPGGSSRPSLTKP